jgi:hypothetical protein
MEQGNRKERLAEALERQFAACHRLLEERVNDPDKTFSGIEQAFRMMRTSALLASVIARLEAAKPGVAQNGGSIPQ